MLNVTPMGVTGVTQLSFADLSPAGILPPSPPQRLSLRDTTFVVVDLETTGGRARSTDGRPVDAITEIGAVKVRGGVVLGEFAILVDPQRSIPPQIVQLTGITTAMVCNAPTIDAVLPMFLEFAGDAVLVAHNAGFDIGFLRAAAERCEIPWPRPQVLCTVRLARRVLSREEAPSVRLAALARLFAVAAQPTHRALDDARATVEVLHALIERVGNQGVHTYADLRSYLPDVTPAQRRKRVLADGLPRRPGVYLFRGPSGEVLYVGTAVDLRRRVSQYFNGIRSPRPDERDGHAGQRGRPCRMRPFAGGRRARAADCWPHMRRRTTAGRGSRSAGGGLSLSDEAFPRLSVVRAPRHDRAIGPFRSRADASDTAALLARFTGVRTCTTRLARSALHGPACPELEVSPCPAARDVTATQYAAAVSRAAALIDGLDNSALGAAVQQVERARRTTPLRERRAIARPHRHRRRGPVARPATARAGDAARTDRRRPRRRRWLPPRRHPPRPTRRRGHRQTRGAADAGRRRHSRWRTSDPARAGAAGRRAGRGDRAHRALAGHPRGAHRAGLSDGWASPLRSAGAWAAWAAAARSARLASQQDPAQAVRERDSELLAEPHPSREQLFGRPGVDGRAGARQPVLPRGQPFSAAG